MVCKRLEIKRLELESFLFELLETHTKSYNAFKFSMAACTQRSSCPLVIPREARLINLSGRASPSGAKPREFERKIYLYIYMFF